MRRTARLFAIGGTLLGMALADPALAHKSTCILRVIQRNSPAVTMADVWLDR